MCCRSGLTVFQVEAQSIFHWFEGLGPQEKQELVLGWASVADAPEEEKKCTFLLENRCSIYPVRPLVCRVQGLPLLLKSGGEDDDLMEEEVELSLCELNFRDSISLPDRGEWLNLDRLNTLLAIAQRQTPASEISVEILNISSNEDARVRLDDLRDLLLRRSGGTVK
jgi:Fe-S-cluster containining protein